MSATAAQAAIDALLRYNPRQRRDDDGKWVKMGGGDGPSVRAQRAQRRGLRPTASDSVDIPDYKPFKSSSWDAAGTSVAFDDGWPKSSDPDDRYAGFWQKRFTSQQAIRQVFRNMAAGKTGDDLYDDVDMDSLMHTSARTYPDGAGEDHPGIPYFTDDDVKADLHNAAAWLHRSLADAPITTQPLYRGMRLKRADVPEVGDTWGSDVMSWAEQRWQVERYAWMPEDPELGRIGEMEVVFRLNGPKRSVDLGPGMLDEHLTQGRYKVVKVSGRGRKRFITVEEVAE